MFPALRGCRFPKVVIQTCGMISLDGSVCHAQSCLRRRRTICINLIYFDLTEKDDQGWRAPCTTHPEKMIVKGSDPTCIGKA
jgi:hypothetical protein